MSQPSANGYNFRVRRLAQPEVLKFAGIAALLTALLCYPRLYLWTDRRYPLWYLEAILFLGSIVLWSFVFAWHTFYTRRPVLTLKIPPWLFTATTLAGVAAGLWDRLFLDPHLRLQVPQEYPANLVEWLARTLFHLSFLQLFVTFAPFAWLMRLVHNQAVAVALTVSFGTVILVLFNRSLPAPVSAGLFSVLVVGRLVMGCLTLWIYLRGGLLLAWWWGLLFEVRLLPDVW